MLIYPSNDVKISLAHCYPDSRSSKGPVARLDPCYNPSAAHKCRIGFLSETSFESAKEDISNEE